MWADPESDRSEDIVVTVGTIRAALGALQIVNQPAESLSWLHAFLPLKLVGYKLKEVLRNAENAVSYSTCNYAKFLTALYICP